MNNNSLAEIFSEACSIISVAEEDSKLKELLIKEDAIEKVFA